MARSAAQIAAQKKAAKASADKRRSNARHAPKNPDGSKMSREAYLKGLAKRDHLADMLVLAKAQERVRKGKGLPTDSDVIKRLQGSRTKK